MQILLQILLRDQKPQQIVKKILLKKMSRVLMNLAGSQRSYQEVQIILKER